MALSAMGARWEAALELPYCPCCAPQFFVSPPCLAVQPIWDADSPCMQLLQQACLLCANNGREPSCKVSCML